MKRFLFSALLLLISLAAFSQEPPVVEPQIDSLEQLDVVRVAPKFKGGDPDKFRKWVNRHIAYPKDALKKGIQGTVILNFAVDVDGTVKDINIVSGVYESIDAEAVRVVSSSPKWECGTINGRPQKVIYTFSVEFII